MRSPTRREPRVTRSIDRVSIADMTERDPMRMSWYELSGNFNVRFGAYRRTSDSYGECYTPAAARTPAIRLQPLSLSADASRRSSAMASAITAAMGAPSPPKQPAEPRVPSAPPARPAPPAKPRRASVAMAEAKLPAFKLSVDDLTRSAAEAGLPFWTREKLQGLFHLFDTDRDNTIERAEFEYVAKQLMQVRVRVRARARVRVRARVGVIIVRVRVRVRVSVTSSSN